MPGEGDVCRDEAPDERLARMTRVQPDKRWLATLGRTKARPLPGGTPWP